MNRRELEEELKKISAGRKFLEEAEPCEEMDERTWEALQQIARAYNTNTQEVMFRLQILIQATREAIEAIAPAVEKLAHIVVELPNAPRTPAEIRRDIKREKNPMRLRQLNKELNESYKACKRR